MFKFGVQGFIFNPETKFYFEIPINKKLEPSAINHVFDHCKVRTARLRLTKQC